MVQVLARERLSWALAAFYFLTFGGFVAFSIYLPTLLKDDFGLTPADAEKPRAFNADRARRAIAETGRPVAPPPPFPVRE